MSDLAETTLQDQAEASEPAVSSWTATPNSENEEARAGPGMAGLDRASPSISDLHAV
jgi:hypothetical protein